MFACGESESSMQSSFGECQDESCELAMATKEEGTEVHHDVYSVVPSGVEPQSCGTMVDTPVAVTHASDSERFRVEVMSDVSTLCDLGVWL